jgi:carbamate kinase
MGPKVESLVEAAKNLQDVKSVLCQPGDAIKALRGETGTTIKL